MLGNKYLHGMSDSSNLYSGQKGAGLPDLHSSYNSKKEMIYSRKFHIFVSTICVNSAIIIASSEDNSAPNQS